MKKLFTFAAAVLASLSLMAAEPNLGTSNWGEGDFATVIANHDGITLSTHATGWSGNFSGVQYIALGGGTDMSATSPTPNFCITATTPIDSIEVFWAPNGSNNTSIAWAGWADAANLLKQDVDTMAKTATYKATKSLDDAIWQKIDLSGKDLKAIMLARQIKKAKINGTQQSNFGDNQTVNVLGIRVWAGPAKEVQSTLVELTAVKVNDEVLDAQQVAFLKNHNTLELTNEYVNAPTVTFTATTTVTYTDESKKVTNADIPVVATDNGAGKWQAQTIINVNTYTVTAVKPSTYEVSYYDGETLLGTENVKAGGKVADNAKYEAKPLATFEGWYIDPELSAAADLTAAINAATKFYGKWTKAYATSINIEGLVLSDGTGYDIKAALTAANYAYTDIDALDTLNDVDKKANRNYAFLGLKVKKATSYLAFNLKKGSSVKVRMGNIGEAFTLKVNGAALDLATKTLANASVDSTNVWAYTATDADALIEFTGFTKDKTVVFKQIMIDADIQIPNLPAPSAYALTLAEVQNGTLAVKVDGATIDLKKKNVLVGATVTITATPDEGYKVAKVTAGDAILEPVDDVYSFVMPAQDITVAAEFSIATAIENNKVSAKAVKVMREGKLFIEKNGVLYNAQGVVVK